MEVSRRRIIKLYQFRCFYIINGDVPGPGQVRVGKQQVGHQVDDVAAGKVGPGFLPEAFGKAPDQILKDVAAVHGADLVRTQVAFRAVEFLDGQVQGVAFHQAFDDVVKVELGKDVLHVRGETGQIVAEVGLDVLGVGQCLSKVNRLVL